MGHYLLFALGSMPSAFQCYGQQLVKVMPLGRHQLNFSISLTYIGAVFCSNVLLFLLEEPIFFTMSQIVWEVSIEIIWPTTWFPRTEIFIWWHQKCNWDFVYPLLFGDSIQISITNIQISSSFPVLDFQFDIRFSLAPFVLLLSLFVFPLPFFLLF